MAKNLFRSDISRENRAQISVISLRRRRRSRRTKGCLGFWPPKSLAKAGQHRLPGGQDAEGPGRLCPGGVRGSRFESEVTLQVGECILGYELTGGKKCRRISSPDWELSRKVTSERGAGRRGAAFGASSRKISVFWAFSRKL